MLDSNLLKQLENALISYQENQETLDVVTRVAQDALGENWMNLLPQIFDDTDIDEATKSTLRDRANHAVHYYGALTAWQEASSYLNDPGSITADALTERIPILEYWLKLFGTEGEDLIDQVKRLYTEKIETVPSSEQTTQKTISPLEETKVYTDIVEENTTKDQQEPISVKTDASNQNMQDTSQKSDEMLSVPEILEDSRKTEDILQEESVEEKPVEQVTAEEPSENVVEENSIEEEPIEEKPLEDVVLKEVPENIVDEKPLEDESSTEQEKNETDIPTAEQEESPQSVELAEIKEAIEQNLEEEAVTTTAINDEVETQQDQPVFEDKNTEGEKTLEEWIDLDSIPSPPAQTSESKETEKVAKEEDVQIVTQNWDVANFLRQKRLYDDANNWLSAWCIRMDNAEKTSYPHYGFIVDLMHDLKEKTQILLENQLLDEIVEKEIPEGRVGLERLLQAIDKEFEGLPDDFKQSTAEKIKLSAREILGEMDTSNEKEFIGPAPDGFELMDDPYETSAQQIIKDFEKTEEEAKNEIDKLNVIEDNKDNQQKKD